MSEYGLVLFSVVNNEYLYLVEKNEDLSYSFLRFTGRRDTTVSTLEKKVKIKLNNKVQIHERWFGKREIEYDDKHICTFFAGEAESFDFISDEYALLSYPELLNGLKDPKEKDLLISVNHALVYYVPAKIYMNHLPFYSFNYKCLPYVPLEEDADIEVKECIKEYKESELYNDIYNCAKLLRYMYGNTSHLEDYHHDDKKYLSEIVFHICFWYPTYLDWLESPRNPKNM